MTRFIPVEAKPYKRTSVFTRQTVPGALKNDHSTKAGVWAQIHVMKGRLLYVICDPASPPSVMELSEASGPGIVLPQEKHCVEITDEVEFYVEFFAVPLDAEPTASGVINDNFAEVHR